MSQWNNTKTTYKFRCEIEVPFAVGYNSKKNKAKASNAVERRIKESLEMNCSFIPIYIIKDDGGSFVEDCSKKTKIKVKKIK